MEEHEHFVKQSYRNRCCILSANGILPLSIPILHGRNAHTKIQEVQISYEYDWQKIHWKSIESGYRCSPFFEYYEDQLIPFYKKKFTFLFDFNQDLLQVLLKFLKIKTVIGTTEEFVKKYTMADDFRNSIHPKNHLANIDKGFLPQPYTQVFGNKFGFVPNLSIIDLVFNSGPSSLDILNQSFCD